MTAPSPPPRATKRGRPESLLSESGRIEAFSDGVFAIAVTLLVLDLHTDSTRGHFAHDLLHQYPTYLAYLTSFVTIGVIWVNHHALFTRISRVDPTMLWLNLVLLATTSVMPFPTAVLASALQIGTTGDRQAATLLFSAISTLMAVSWLLIYRYLGRSPELLIDPADQGSYDGQVKRALIGIPCYAAIGIAGLVVPLVSAVLIFVMPVFYAVTSHTQNWKAGMTGKLTAGPDA